MSFTDKVPVVMQSNDPDDEDDDLQSVIKVGKVLFTLSVTTTKRMKFMSYAKISSPSFLVFGIHK